MRIYIAGGSGFLGHHLIPKLEAMGHEVLAPRSYQVNLMDREQLDLFMRRALPDVVIHLAAYYGGLGINYTEPHNLFFFNTIMAANLIDAAARNGTKKIIPIGSSCSYPALLEDLKEENFWDGRCDDSVEAYGFSKKLQVVGLTAYRKMYNFDFCHLVLTNMYGEHDDFGEYRGHAISALMKKFADAVKKGESRVTCWGDGSPIREFLYVGDAAEAIARFVEGPHDPDPINIGTGVGVSIAGLVDIIIEATKYKGEVVWDTDKPNGMFRKVMDVSKMKKALKWVPPTDLREGIQRTLDWYREF